VTELPRELTPEDVVAILQAGDFDGLLGVLEDNHIECKRAPYQLDSDHVKLELAKDISALANHSALHGVDGGHILLGVRTEKAPDHHGDVVVEVSPFLQGLVNPGTYHNVTQAWLLPVPEGIEVRWYPSAADAIRGIVAITVPRQRPESWPFIVTKTVDAAGKIVGHVVAYFERQRDGVVPLPASELQRLLRDGRRLDTLADLGAQVTALAEEVRSLSQQQPPPAPAFSFALDQYPTRRAQAISAAGVDQEAAFVLTAAPVQGVKLRNLFRGSSDPLVVLLGNPPTLRPRGWNVASGEPRIVPGLPLRRAVKEGRTLLECWSDGGLIFAGSIDFLCWGTRKNSGPLRINPLALAESTYSFADLTRRIYQDYADPRPEDVEFSITLYRVEQRVPPWVLTLGRLKSMAFQMRHEEQPAPTAGDSFAERLSQSDWSRPGVVSYRLLRDLYVWFGFNEDDVAYSESAQDGERVISPDQIIKDGGE
jgi:hypothetical protein